MFSEVDMMTIHKHISRQNYVKNGGKANQMWSRREGNDLNKTRSCQLQQNLKAALLENANVPLFTHSEAGPPPTWKSSPTPAEFLFLH